MLASIHEGSPSSDPAAVMMERGTCSEKVVEKAVVTLALINKVEGIRSGNPRHTYKVEYLHM